MLRLTLRVAAAGAATAIALAACSSFSEDAPAGAPDAGPEGSTTDDGGKLDDASTGDTGTDASKPPCDKAAAFGNVQEVGGVNSGTGDYGAWLTPDEKTIYFTSYRQTGGTRRIYRATREALANPFSGAAPAPLANNVQLEEHATLADDESWMFFSRGASPTREIYFAPKQTASFNPMLASGSVNSAFDDVEPSFAPATGILLFASTREGAYKIFGVDARPDGGTGALAVALPNINQDAGASTFAPVMSADGLTLYFASDRDSGSGKAFIYAATRPMAGGAFDNVKQLSSLAPTTAADDRPNWASPDGCRLYFSSDRHPDGKMRIYVASRP